MGRRRLRDARPQRSGLVAEDAEIDGDGAEASQERGEHRPVGVENPGRRQGLAGRCQLVAGREERDRQGRPQRQRGQATGGRECDVLRPEARPGAERRAAAGDVLAGPPTIGARHESFGQDDAAVVDPDVLLHDDGVGPRGHRRPGEDAHGRARTGIARRMAGRHASADGQARLAAGREIGRAQGVAVHRGVVEGRQIEGRDHIVREDPAVRIRERDCLGPGQDRESRPDQSQRVGDPHRRGGGVEAVGAQAAHGAAGSE